MWNVHSLQSKNICFAFAYRYRSISTSALALNVEANLSPVVYCGSAEMINSGMIGFNSPRDDSQINLYGLSAQRIYCAELRVMILAWTLKFILQNSNKAMLNVLMQRIIILKNKFKDASPLTWHCSLWRVIADFYNLWSGTLSSGAAVKIVNLLAVWRVL